MYSLVYNDVAGVLSCDTPGASAKCQLQVCISDRVVPSGCHYSCSALAALPAVESSFTADSGSADAQCALRLLFNTGVIFVRSGLDRAPAARPLSKLYLLVLLPVLVASGSLQVTSHGAHLKLIQVQVEAYGPSRCQTSVRPQLAAEVSRRY